MSAQDRNKNEQDGKAEEEMNKIARDHNDREDLHREQNLLYQISLYDQHICRFEGRGNEPDLPGEQPTEEEERIQPGRALESRISGHDDKTEHNRVDDEQKERIKKRPKESQHRSPIAGFQFAAHEVLDENPVLVQAHQVLNQPDHGSFP